MARHLFVSQFYYLLIIAEILFLMVVCFVLQSYFIRMLMSDYFQIVEQHCFDFDLKNLLFLQ
jgi:hypothetical protein